MLLNVSDNRFELAGGAVMIKIAPVTPSRTGSRLSEEFAREKAPAWQPTDLVNHTWSLDTTHQESEPHTDHDQRLMCPPEVYIG